MTYNSIVALVTPFRNNNIDFESLKNLIEFHIESKTDGVLVCGSTGEGLLLSEREREKIISYSKEVAKGRVKIISGCSACSTKEAIELVNQAEKLNVDGALVIAPYYVKPTQEGIKQHFKSVCENSNIPIIMYNNPGRCSVNMTCETILELSQIKNITGLKDSDTDLSKATLIRKNLNKDFDLLSGDDPSLLGYLSHGGNGTISVLANIVPHLVKQMITLFEENKISEAQNINQKLTELSLNLFMEANPIPVKYALSKKGLIENELRLPLTKASKKTMDKIDGIFESL